MSGGSSVTTAELPPELRGLFTDAANQMSRIMGYNVIGELPTGPMAIQNYFEMDPQQFAGMSDLERMGMGMVPQLFQPSDALQGMYGGATQLMNMQPWRGVDLSGAGGYTIGGSQGGGISMPGGSPYPQPAPSRQPLGPASPAPMPPGYASSGSTGVGPSMPSGYAGSVYPSHTPPHWDEPVEPPEPDPGGGGGGGGGGEPPKPPGNPGPRLLGYPPYVEVGGGPPQPEQPPGPGATPPEGSGYTPFWFPGQREAPGMGQGPAPLALPGHVAQPNLPGQFNPETQYDVGKYGGIPGMGDINATQVNPYQEFGHWAEGIDFANHPALTAAMEAFEQGTMPGIQSAMEAQGLGTSGAHLDAIARGKAQMAVPILQQIMGQELQDKGLNIQQRLGARGQDVTQRGQTLGSMAQMGGLGLQARGQDISSFLQGRGQDIGGLMGLYQGDISQRGQDIGGILQGRGQDLNALLQQGAQALQAQGLDQSALTSGIASLGQLQGLDMQRLLAGLDQSRGFGGIERDIINQQNAANYDEMMRRYGLARDAIWGPFGQAQSQIGSRTEQGK